MGQGSSLCLCMDDSTVVTQQHTASAGVHCFPCWRTETIPLCRQWRTLNVEMTTKDHKKAMVVVAVAFFVDKDRVILAVNHFKNIEQILHSCIANAMKDETYNCDRFPENERQNMSDVLRGKADQAVAEIGINIEQLQVLELTVEGRRIGRGFAKEGLTGIPEPLATLKVFEDDIDAVSHVVFRATPPTDYLHLRNERDLLGL